MLKNSSAMDSPHLAKRGIALDTVLAHTVDDDFAACDGSHGEWVAG